MKNLLPKSRWLITIEIASAVFGVIGVTLGILSIIALKMHIWSDWDKIYGEEISAGLTISTVIFDTFSSTSALAAYFIGSNIMKIKISENLEITKKEKIINLMDFISFWIGLIGLVFSILSLVYIHDEPTSIMHTIISIVFDSISAIIVFFVVYKSIGHIKHLKIKK